MVKKLKNSNYDKTQIMAKLEIFKIMKKKKTLKGSFSKNN